MYALLDLFFCLTQFDRFAQFIEDQYSFSDRFFTSESNKSREGI